MSKRQASSSSSSSSSFSSSSSSSSSLSNTNTKESNKNNSKNKMIRNVAEQNQSGQAVEGASTNINSSNNKRSSLVLDSIKEVRSADELFPLLQQLRQADNPLFRSTKARDAVLAASKHVTTPETAFWFAKFFAWFATPTEGQELLCASKSEKKTELLGNIFARLVLGGGGGDHQTHHQQSDSTARPPEPLITTADSARMICIAINNICCSDLARDKVFLPLTSSSAAVVASSSQSRRTSSIIHNMFIRLVELVVSSASSLDVWCRALNQLCGSDCILVDFVTPEFAQVLSTTVVRKGLVLMMRKNSEQQQQSTSASSSDAVIKRATSHFVEALISILSTARDIYLRSCNNNSNNNSNDTLKSTLMKVEITERQFKSFVSLDLWNAAREVIQTCADREEGDTLISDLRPLFMLPSTSITSSSTAATHQSQNNNNDDDDNADHQQQLKKLTTTTTTTTTTSSTLLNHQHSPLYDPVYEKNGGDQSLTARQMKIFDLVSKGKTRLFAKLNSSSDFGPIGLDEPLKDDAKMIHVACQWEQLEFAELLLKRGATLSSTDAQGQQPLHRCAAWNRVESCQWVLKNGGDVNARDNLGRTPLMYAALFGHQRVADFLVSNGANVHAVDNSGKHAATLADERGNRRVARSLLNLINTTTAPVSTTKTLNGGISFLNNRNSNTTPLLSSPHTDILATQQQQASTTASGSATTTTTPPDVAVDAATVLGRKLLKLANNGYHQVVRDVITKEGADVNFVDPETKKTPLQAASASGNFANVQLLLEFGALINARNADGETARDLAVRRGRHRVLQVFDEWETTHGQQQQQQQQQQQLQSSISPSSVLHHQHSAQQQSVLLNPTSVVMPAPSSLLLPSTQQHQHQQQPLTSVAVLPPTSTSIPSTSSPSPSIVVSLQNENSSLVVENTLLKREAVALRNENEVLRRRLAELEMMQQQKQQLGSAGGWNK